MWSSTQQRRQFPIKGYRTMENYKDYNNYKGFWDTTPPGFRKIGTQTEESEVLKVEEIRPYYPDSMSYWERLKMWMYNIYNNATSNKRKKA